MIEQAARACRAIAAEYVRLACDQRAEPTQQIAAAFDPEQRIGCRDLKGARERRVGKLRQPLGIGLQRTFRIR